MFSLRTFLPYLSVLMLVACAGAPSRTSWVHPDYAGQAVRSVLIIGSARQELARRLFEDRLAVRLAERGVHAITSYRHLDLVALDDKDATTDKVRELGVSSVIVARVVDQRTDTVVTPGYSYLLRGPGYRPLHLGDHWYDHYRSSAQLIHHPARVDTIDVYTVETSLYLADGDMVWAMQSETVPGETSLEHLISDYVDEVVADLLANGLI